MIELPANCTSYPITPVPKPRMTRRDKWMKRKCVLEYRAFKDECRLRKVDLPKRGAHIIFVIPMPKSWPLWKTETMFGKPHEKKPDLDNLIKALCDAVYEEDSAISQYQAEKVWGYWGEIIIGRIADAA